MSFTLSSKQLILQDGYSYVVSAYKPVGKTPLECVEDYKRKHQLDPSITVSYAGRLDPMAEGVLLLLIGEANKKRREYEHLSKEYEVTVLVGFSTDTGDLMGKIEEVQGTRYWVKSQKKLSLRVTQGRCNLITRDEIKRTSPLFIGSIEQRYPIYSSAKVQGKPLYWWARQGRLSEIEVPTHKVHIDSIELNSEGTITESALLKYIVDSVGSVQGDFRQHEIIMKWKEVLRESKDHINHSLFTLHITCGSGTYMRQLVTDIGGKVGTPMCAFKIKRTRVGEYR